MNEPEVVAQHYRDSTNLATRIDLHRKYSTNMQGWHEWVFERLLDLPSEARILEIGCGNALLWKKNLDRIPVGWEIVLSDVSPGMLDDAKRNLSDYAGRFQYAVEDANRISFANTSFDAVIANHMLYHVPDLDRTLSEIRRILKTKGRCFAATNGAAHMQELAVLVRQFDESIDLWQDDYREQFGLDNGADLLAPWFEFVTLERYVDALVVPDADALTDYIVSMARVRPLLDEAKEAQLRSCITDRIATHGPIRIQKDTGMFLAR
jgi:ubiquinone/menaquinone biosynthesis C-methylase UbiE